MASSSPSTLLPTCTTTTQPHLLASKRRRRELGTMIHEHASAPVSTKAQAMLENMGWTANTGLGKRRDGIVSHIRAVKRADATAGLGVSALSAEQAVHMNGNEWWKDAAGGTLAKLASKSASKKQKRDSSKSTNKIHYTDQELFEATGGKRFGMRAAPTNNLHKWKRTNDQVTDAASDETTSKSQLDSDTVISDQLNATKDGTADEAVSSKKKKKDKKAKKEKKAKKNKDDKSNEKKRNRE